MTHVSTATSAHDGGHPSTSTTRTTLLITGGHHAGDTPTGGGRGSSPPQGSSRAAHTVAGAHTPMENTFRQEPSAPFPGPRVHAIAQDALEEALAHREYDPLTANTLTKEVTQTINGRLRLLGRSNFKLVTFVLIGQNRQASATLASRCLWNTAFDNFVQASYRTKDLYAEALVFSVYRE